MSDFRIDQITNQAGTAGPNIAGITTFSSTSGLLMPRGDTFRWMIVDNVVKDGLVLYLDAGNDLSYPGSGTLWRDFSGFGNNGTLVNGPTYSSTNGGSIVFDGSNDYVNLGPSIITGNQSFSWGAWIYPTGTGTPVFFGNTSAGLAMVSLWDSSNNKVRVGIWGADILTSGTAIPSSTWGYTFWTWNGTTLTSYTNGIADGTATGFSFNISSLYTTIGNALNAQYFTGRISSTKIYNRALSAAEVAQNYDALKVRYTGYTNTFTPLCGGGSGKVEVLCVAGGGGGGTQHGGGGGAGGLIYNSAFTVNSNTGIGVTVGGGGSGSPTGGSFNCPSGGDGGQSVFSTITSTGGGGGSSVSNPVTPGRPGGSGGGCALAGAGSGSTGAGGLGNSPALSPSQGNAGGAYTGYDGSNNYGGGGGGGGASASGEPAPQPNGASWRAGNGGAGRSSSISGASVTYAGGGGGGSHTPFTFGLGGLGGGGNGGLGNDPSPIGDGKNGIPNTGSGGGGGGAFTANGGGGSNGIIIVRYPATDYNVELLIVGGGGGGGWSLGSGGGAGGLLYYSSYPVSAGTKYAVTVGSGSSGMNSTIGYETATTNGNNSIMGPLIAFGGGGGTGQSVNYPNGTGGKSGGSGSGGTRNQNTPGQGVAGQGNAGGRGSDTAGSYGGGGGGGAGAVGGDGSGSGGGTGGNGLAFSISGISSYYAGGGGGSSNSGASGAGGLGGGGAGNTGGNGTSAVANTGGGGGGGDAAGGGTIGGAGGSGIIIIAYQGPQRGVGGTVDTTSRPGYTLHKFTTTETDFFIP